MGGVIRKAEEGKVVIGGVIIVVFLVTEIVEEDALFFASFAVAVIVCVPSITLELFQLKLYGDVVNVLNMAPSIVTLTDETPTLSEAETAMLIVPEIELPFVGLVIVTVGGVISDNVIVLGNLNDEFEVFVIVLDRYK
jgi:hypothetical protein